MHMLRLMLYFIILNFSYSCKVIQDPIEASTSQTFERLYEGKLEKIKIDFDRQLFSYCTEIDGQEFIGNGNLQIQESFIEFEFPAFSEYIGLPFFSKEYWDLKWIDTAQHFEIDISLIDVDSQQKVRRHIPFFVSPMNSTTVYKSDDRRKLVAETSASEIDLIFHRVFKGNDTIPIPSKGKYQLSFQMVGQKTKVLSSSTNRGCFMDTINPIVEMTICNEINDKIQSFDFNQDCLNKFEKSN